MWSKFPDICLIIEGKFWKKPKLGKLSDLEYNPGPLPVDYIFLVNQFLSSIYAVQPDIRNVFY